MNSFLQQNGPESMQTFSMEQMRRDLESYDVAFPQTEPPGWAAEFNPSQHARVGVTFSAPKIGGLVPSGLSPAEFQRFQQMERHNAKRLPGSLSQTPVSMNGYQRPMRIGYGMNMGMMSSPYRPLRVHATTPLAVEASSKGKERMVELDDRNWEQQFAEMDEAGQRDLDAEANAAMEVELNDLDRSVFSDVDEFELDEFIWQSIEAKMAASGRTFDELKLRMDHDNLGKFDAWDGFDSFAGNYRDPQLGNYLFEQENVFSAHRDPFNEGLKIINEGGNLSLAALAFEAAVQQDPQHIQAWSMLGSVQAQNEKESPAIRALEQTLKLDSSNLSALMGLAISYTNEEYDITAYRTLERWLSIKYPEIVSPQNLTPDSDFGYSERQLLHEKVTALFIRAAQLSPQGEHMDPDVQVGLGVLFYGAEEHGKAVDCFEAALASSEAGASNHPDQAHLLWNRLGATLANSGRSEEAIAAYEKALTLKPNFVRARYNLGVSCINIGCFEEAAQHLLGALSMHRVVEREGIDRIKEVIGGNGDRGEASGLDDEQVERLVGMNQSTNLLETLRRVFGSMSRKDLAERVEVGMDVDAFRGEFEF